MRVSMKWLNDLVDVTLSVPELVDRLDLTGTAVDGVETVGEALDGVVVGLIVAKDRHPEADKLWVTKVDVGAEEPLTVVCGAQNFEAGDRVPVALVGATLPNGMTIKKAKLRGVPSEGMNCSATELGIGADASGLLILPADAPVGVPFAEYRGLADTVIELEVTPNRPDCLSMAGVAREVAAITATSYRHPGGAPAEQGAPVADSVRVEIVDPDLCPRYTARLIRNVKLGPSPDWLAERVSAAGARSISNIVDITNYVMFELGQPLHAFDASTIARDADGRAHIIVRGAAEGERLATLDGQERVLKEGMILITDPSGPIALGGVMGGETTEVSEATVDILLEAASFEPASISRTSRSLGLISEASSRFEKGVDREACVAALDRAAQLMADLAGGEVAPGVVDVYPRPHEPVTLSLRLERTNAVLGTNLTAEEVASILRSLELGVTGGPSVFEVRIPSFRPDLVREIDLVEEVLRVWGMERVEATLPGGRQRVGGLTPSQRVVERIGATMRAAGLNETMTYAFCDPADLERIGRTLPDDEMLVELINPMSEEQAVLRRTLLPNLLRSVSSNQRHGVANVHLYEIGSVFWTAGGRKSPKERTVVAGVLAGSWDEPAWSDALTRDSSADAELRSKELNFFDGKGVLEALAIELGFPRFAVRVAEMGWLQPGRAAEVIVNGDVVGWLGEVHPLALRAFEASGPVVAFELLVEPLIKAARPKKYDEVPRFPAIEIDVALVVDEATEAARVQQAIVSAGGKLLEAAHLFDVYRGPGVAEGKKSLAYSLRYRATDRTLTDDEVLPQHERLLRKVAGAVGAELRG